VRTTHYLGPDLTEATDRYFQIRKDWIATRNEQRKAFDEEQARRRQEKLPPLERFKPVWKKTVERTAKNVSVSQVIQQPTLPTAVQLPAYPVAAFSVQAERERAEIFGLTIKQAYDRYLPQQKARIGLHGGKGINENSYEKHENNLTLALALNKSYARESKPIDVNKRLCDLTKQDYEAFVQFWCNPANAKSERTSKNYVGAFGRMLRRIRIPLPDDFETLFNIKLTQPTRIVRYDAALLRQCCRRRSSSEKILSRCR
jgi:hypothetical protein